MKKIPYLLQYFLRLSATALSFFFFLFLFFDSGAVLLSIQTSFIFGCGLVFIIAFRMRDCDFDVAVVLVEAVIKLLPDLVNCGKVLLVSGIGFGLLGVPVFPG
jgi:hypothetical protein